MDKNQDYQEKLRQLSLQLFMSEENQRRIIASDLHDHVGQALAMLKFKLGKLKGDAVFCGLDRDIDEMRKLIDQIIKYTRDLTLELSPPILHELGFSKALLWLCAQMKEKCELNIVLKDEFNEKIENEKIRIALFRSVQELLFNVVKHSGTLEARLTLQRLDGQLVIAIYDRGIGFEVDGKHSHGFGLFSIKERLSSLGGLLQINSELKKGTEIILRMKMDEFKHTDR